MYHKIKSLVIASLYPLLYFVCQLVIQVIMLQMIIYRYGRDNNPIQKVNQKMYMMTLYAAILCFLILFLISTIKRQKLFKDYNKISFRQGVFYAISTVGLYMMIVIMNGILIQFFPSYSDQIMDLFQLEQPVLAILVIGVIAPFIEELIFRGEVYKELEKSFTIPVVVFLQAALFGLIHPIPLQKIQTFVMGLFFGYVRAKTQNIWYSTIMHITSNMIACLLVFIVL